MERSWSVYLYLGDDDPYNQNSVELHHLKTNERLPTLNQILQPTLYKYRPCRRLVWQCHREGVVPKEVHLVPTSR